MTLTPVLPYCALPLSSTTEYFKNGIEKRFEEEYFIFSVNIHIQKIKKKRITATTYLKILIVLGI